MLTSIVTLLLLADPTGVAHLKVTLVKVTASEQKAAVTKVVNGQLQPLKGCYDLALKDTPELAGELQLNLTLEAGQPGMITVDDSSTVKDDTLAQCMMARLRATPWPKTRSGATATVRLKVAH